MCGRYMITTPFEAIAHLFEADLADLGPDAARPNVSPTEAVPVVVSHDADRTIVPMRWGPASLLVQDAERRAATDQRPGAARLTLPAPDEMLVATPVDAATREILARRA